MKPVRNDCNSLKVEQRQSELLTPLQLVDEALV